MGNNNSFDKTSDTHCKVENKISVCNGHHPSPVPVNEPAIPEAKFMTF